MPFISDCLDVGRVRLFDIRLHGLATPAILGDWPFVARASVVADDEQQAATQNKQHRGSSSISRDASTTGAQQSSQRVSPPPQVFRDPMAALIAMMTAARGGGTGGEAAAAAGRRRQSAAAADDAQAAEDPSARTTTGASGCGAAAGGTNWVRRLARDMHVSHHLRGHTGCVNSIEFNHDATILLTGSDDTRVGLFATQDKDWRSIAMIPTAHTRNIFNAVFLPNTNDTQLVSCGLDGNTVLTTLGPDGTYRASAIVAESDFMCSSIEISPLDGNLAYVSRGSGGVAVVDVRNRRSVGEFSVSSAITNRPCHGLACHPLYPFLLAVGSDSQVVYLCDVRMLPPTGPLSSTAGRTGRAASTSAAAASSSSSSAPVTTDGGASFLSICNFQASAHAEGIGGLNFSERGDRLVVSYKSGDVVSYDWTVALPASNRRKLSAETSSGLQLADELNTCKYAQVTEVPAKVYRGRENRVTMFKEAAFFADDRYVVSGGDCGNVFVWDAQSCRLVAKCRGDSDVVNGVLTHPALPVVVCCGIDSVAKVISTERLHKVVENERRCPQLLPLSSSEETGDADGDSDSPSMFRLRQALLRGFFAGRVSHEDEDEDENAGAEDEGGGDVDFDLWGAEQRGGSAGAGDSDDEDAHEANEALRELVCATVAVLQQPMPVRGTVEQLTTFFRARARALRHLIEESSRHTEGDDEQDEEAENEGEEDGDGEDDEEGPQSSQETGATTTTASDDAAAVAPTSGAPRRSARASQHTAESEDDEDEEAETDSDATSDETDDEDGDATDDALLHALLNAVQPTLDLARKLITRCARGGVLSDDPVNPTVAAQPPQERQPALDLAAAMIDVAYIALLDKNRLQNLSMGMRQAFTATWLRVLGHRSSLCAAAGDLDGAMTHAMELLDEDSTRLDALGVAVGVVRARETTAHPEPESFLDQLSGFARGIAESRVQPTASRRTAMRLQQTIAGLKRQRAERRSATVRDEE